MKGRGNADAEIDAEDAPVNFRYLEIDAPDTMAIEEMDPGALGES